MGLHFLRFHESEKIVPPNPSKFLEVGLSDCACVSVMSLSQKHVIAATSNLVFYIYILYVDAA